MSKSITIYGDLIQDINLMEQPLPPSWHFQNLPQTIQLTTAGGVAFLKKMLQSTLPECAISAPQIEKNEWEKDAVKVFQTWSKFPQMVNSKDKVWRISKLMGRTLSNGSSKADDLIKEAAHTDVLIIDSMGMGFLETNMMWENPNAGDLKESEKWKPLESLLRKANPDHVVFKLSSFNDGLPLPCTSALLDKLTVVIPVKALRERGAAISEGLSWDRTINDIVKEFSSGLSRRDLALCRRVVVLFSMEGAAVFERDGSKTIEGADRPLARLKRFIYQPSQYEGTFNARHPGYFFGDLTILTAAMVRHILDPGTYPLFFALSLGLSAMHAVHTEGIPEDKKKNTLEERLQVDMPLKTGSSILTLNDALQKAEGTVCASDKEAEVKKEEIKKIKDQISACLDQFACTFDHRLLSDDELRNQKEGESNLLRDTTGYGFEYVAAKATEIIIKGTKEALKHVPVVSYGKFLTADREEIERINAIRKLITSYLANPGDAKPLSIAVFGPPGAGKSFAIKQLADELGFEKKLIHEFNLSQFRRDNIQELHTAFHLVRDASMRGKVPLIFWDEFDSDGYHWLKEFLAPMQDAEFRVGSVTHPFNKAIFIFAGGVTETFQQLDAKTGDQAFKDLKGPDFISRLRGYVNIKGPNKPKSESSDKTKAKARTIDTDPNDEFLIRRAILFRSLLERSYSHLIGEDRIAAVSAPVVQAFLRVKTYKHGARSMESLITMSNLANARFFGESCLPSDDLMNLHVDAGDFRQLLEENTLEQPMIELISAAYHEAWQKEKRAQGYDRGEERNDEGPVKTHPLLKPYAELSEKDKEANRITARLTRPKLHQVGLKIVWQGPTPTAGRESIPKKYIDDLILIEHDIWLRDHLLGGYEYAPVSNDILRVHKNIACFEDLEKEDKKLDEAIIHALDAILKDQHYTVEKI